MGGIDVIFFGNIHTQRIQHIHLNEFIKEKQAAGDADEPGKPAGLMFKRCRGHEPRTFAGSGLKLAIVGFFKGFYNDFDRTTRRLVKFRA